MEPPFDFEVAIIGGGLIGSMAGVMLQRRGVRTLILEGRPAGKEQKVVVGEAITEGSSLFLRHEIGLGDWLGEHAFRKFGFCFVVRPRSGAEPRVIEDCHELLLSTSPLEHIPKALERLIPTYHVERTSMNHHTAELARAAGACYLDGAHVERVELGDGAHRVDYTLGGEHRQARCRFILDASGRRTFLGRQLGIIRWVKELDTAAVWNRFSGVCRDPEVWRSFHGIDRRRHTIHFSGPGFWIWWIHQSDQLTSVGVSYDKAVHQPNVKTGDLGFGEMIRKFPPVTALLEGARALEPYQSYAHLAYVSDHWVDGRGYALLGDAAWSTDALYSVGVETACRQLVNVIPMVVATVRGHAPAPAAFGRLNQEFVRCARAVVAVNRFKYSHAWGDPHLLMQTAVYELGEIAALYHLQRRSRWIPKLQARHYRLQWYSPRKLRALERFLAGSLKDAGREQPGALLKKALLPGKVIYRATWPLWRVPGGTPYFFRLIRGWAYSERLAQRSRLWPDALSFMARRRLSALVRRSSEVLDAGSQTRAQL